MKLAKTATKPAGKYERITISLPKPLLERIDAHTARSRSAAVRDLVEKALATEVDRPHEVEVEFDEAEYELLEAFTANGGTVEDAVRHGLRHQSWLDECRRRELADVR